LDDLLYFFKLHLWGKTVSSATVKRFKKIKKELNGRLLYLKGGQKGRLIFEVMFFSIKEW